MVKQDTMWGKILPTRSPSCIISWWRTSFLFTGSKFTVQVSLACGPITNALLQSSNWNFLLHFLAIVLKYALPHVVCCLVPTHWWSIGMPGRTPLIGNTWLLLRLPSVSSMSQWFQRMFDTEHEEAGSDNKLFIHGSKGSISRATLERSPGFL